MKTMLIMFAVIALPARADIFVCQDDKNRTIYQDEPCATQTIRTIKNVPGPTPEEQAIAQQRIDQINETYRLRATETELERLEQEKRDIELEKIALEKQRIELLEQQALNERHPYPIYVNPRYRNRYGGPWLNKPPYRKFPNRPPRNSQSVNPPAVNSPNGNLSNNNPSSNNPSSNNSSNTNSSSTGTAITIPQ
jgi:hypothetical protein